MESNSKPHRNIGSVDGQGGSRVASRRGTGPRTPTGKEKSKYNALKSGLYAKAVLLSYESPSQFDALLQGLQHDFLPVGTLENLLVEKLAAIIWRYRRLLQAESAEIQKRIEDEEEDKAGFSHRAMRLHAYLEKTEAESDRLGKLPGIDKYPEFLEDCLDKLHELRERAERYGLKSEVYSTYLGRIYGARYPGRRGKDLFDYYLECLSALNPQRELDCVQRFVAATEEEIRRLERHWKHALPEPKPHPPLDENRAKTMGLLKFAIPDPGDESRFLAYEAHLERLLDRTLAQLEHLQRMRKSQITIQVEHPTTMCG